MAKYKLSDLQFGYIPNYDKLDLNGDGFMKNCDIKFSNNVKVETEDKLFEKLERLSIVKTFITIN
jgi:hypothetical protein